MSEILLQYKRPDPATWVYLSSFLTIGLFFVFHRFWSLRNVDLVLLILLAPGLLMVHEGRKRRLLEFEQAAISSAADPSNESPPLSGDESSSPPRDSNSNSSSDPEASLDANASRVGVSADEVEPSETQDIETEAEEAGPTDSETMAGTTIPGGGLGEINQAVVMSSVEVERYGFVWLLSVQVLILLRLVFDPMMVRRPLLEPNLTTGGMLFLGVWLFIFMMANVITSTPRIQIEQGPQLGPGYSLMKMLPAIPTRPVEDAISGANAQPESEPAPVYVTLARILAITAHLGIVTGIIGIGYRHFNNSRSGVGCAMLYLLLPYTAQTTGRVDHALPAVLLVWAVLSYRRPYIAGLFLGAAGGLVYYPLFLLPLWVSFYWLRGVGRFAGGAFTALAIMVALLVVNRVVADDKVIDGVVVGASESLGQMLVKMFGLMMPPMKDLSGIWGLGWEPMYRLPILVAFLILSGFLAIWPAQKNLGTLIGCSAAMMVGAQFWHAHGGGLYMAWFLPLLLLTIFRPNLEDRVALKVIDGGRASSATKPRVAVDAA